MGRPGLALKLAAGTGGPPDPLGRPHPFISVHCFASVSPRRTVGSGVSTANLRSQAACNFLVGMIMVLICLVRQFYREGIPAARQPATASDAVSDTRLRPWPRV